MECSPNQWQDSNSNCIPQKPFRQYMFYATLISTIAWCCVVVLAINAFRAKFMDRDTPSAKLRHFLLCYVVLMTACSTASLIQDVVFTHRVLFSFGSAELAQLSELLLVGTPHDVALPLVVFGADALMAWRCWVLYQGIGRIARVLANSFLAILSIGSLAITSCATYKLAKPGLNPIIPTPLVITSVTINLVLSTMIVSRILGHERDMKKIMGVEREGRASPFRRAMAMCIESCALIVVCSAVVLGITLSQNKDVSMVATIPFGLLTEICVISPLLLIVRVANGRAHSTTSSSLSTGIPEGRHSNTGRRYSIRFFHSATNVSAEHSTLSVGTPT